MSAYLFNLRVTLSRATGGSLKDYYKDSLKDLKQLTSGLLNDQNGNNHEEKTITWQTKIFSKREFLLYSSESFDPQNILEKNYKEDCLKLK